MHLYDLVRVGVTAAPGLGDIALGSGVDGGRSFADAAVVNGSEVTYAVEDTVGRETRRGIYTAAGPTLARGTLLSSTTGAALTLTAAAKVSILPVSEDLNFIDHAYGTLFGDGSDGPLTASSGLTTLSRDAFYTTVTLSGTARIATNGFRLHCWVLDLSGADGAGPYINNEPTNATGTTAGTVSGTSGGTLGAAGGGNNGAAGNIGAGSQGAAPTAMASASGGVGGAGGSGGTGTGGAGGGGRSPTNPSHVPGITRTVDKNGVYSSGSTILAMRGGNSGAAGSGGGGDGTNAGRTGGGSGVGGSNIQVFAGELITSGSTASLCITSRGGQGGWGANASVGDVGGGGGAGGGGGGYIYMVVKKRTGPVVTGFFDVSGGTGGSGGGGNGSGAGGRGGQGGGRGRVEAYNAGTNTWSFLDRDQTASTAPAPSGISGTTGTTGTTGALDF